MRKTLYESLRIAFPELNDTAIPEEQDEFEHFVRWLNSDDELIDRIIVTYNHTFGDEEPMQLIE